EGERPAREIVAAREAVDDAARLPRSFLLEEGGGLVVGLPGMNDDGKPHLSSEAHLPPEGLALHGPRRVVVVEVEPDLADGHDPALAREAAELVVDRLGGEPGLMRVDAGRGREAQ